jgi:hypothetical protein
MSMSPALRKSAFTPIGLPFHSAWESLMYDLVYKGESVSPRGMPCYELRNVTFTSPMEHNILYHPVRNLNYRFMIAEWLWMSLGREDVESVGRYNSHIKKFSDNGETFNGAYGPRWLHQRQFVLNSLGAKSSEVEGHPLYDHVAVHVPRRRTPHDGEDAQLRHLARSPVRLLQLFADR